jgi:outer membrane biosynthesis protein TonB
MAGPAPKTRMWSARENAHKPKGFHLITTGLVEVSDADKVPVLTKGSGGAAKVLPLDLAVKACKDPAIKAAVWKHAYLHEDVGAGQYQRVSIRWDGKEIANVEVIDDREQSGALAVMTKAANAKHATKPPAKPKPKPAKKAAKKASKPKKAPKKPAKKAKKPAKKSALKKMVSKLVKKLTPKKAKKKGGR